MIDPHIVLFGLAAFILAAHLVSTALAIYRVRRRRPSRSAFTPTPVTLLRPVCGHDPFDPLTLRSSFDLDYDPVEIVFCVARSRDPGAALVKDLIARAPAAEAQLLIGDERPTANPKLNNLVKGWSAARAPWVIMADSNVLLPPTAIAELFEAWRAETGLVCSPPVGTSPIGFTAHIECAFLNSYQARWQLAADTLGFGFAQGKTMLWRRELLDRAGGITALGRELAEDAAATKIVRAQGLKVRLVDRPFPQPLGRRRLTDIWNRQVRWARLRRATFPLCFLPEITTSGLVPILATITAASGLGLDPLLAGTAVTALWYGAEVAMCAAAGWPLSWSTPLAFLARDILLPAIWIEGLTGDDFTWRGNEMSVATAAAPGGELPAGDKGPG